MIVERRGNAWLPHTVEEMRHVCVTHPGEPIIPTVRLMADMCDRLIAVEEALADHRPT